MTSTCYCSCCQTRGCTATLQGTFAINGSNQCTSQLCTQNFPVQCKKDTSIGGVISASTINPSRSENRNNSGLTIPIWPFIIAGVLLIGLVAFCIFKRKKNKEQSYPMGPTNLPAYQYNQGQQGPYGQGQVPYGQTYQGQQYPNQQYQGQQYGNTGGTGISPLAAGAGGLAVGGLGGYMAGNLFGRNHHGHGDGYDHGHSGYGNNYGGHGYGNSADHNHSGGNTTTTVDNLGNGESMVYQTTDFGGGDYGFTQTDNY